MLVIALPNHASDGVVTQGCTGYGKFA
jgi:hypothetical protein